MFRFAKDHLRPITRYAERFLYVLGPSGRKGLVPIVAGFVFLSLLDLIGLSLVGPFVALATDGEQVRALPMLAGIGDLLGTESFDQLIAWAGLAIVAVFLIKAFAGFAVNRAIIRFAYQHQKSIKLRLLRAYLSLPVEDALRKNSAELLTTVNQHSMIFTNRVMTPLLKGASEVVFFAFLFVFLLINNPWVTSLLGLAFVLIGLVYDAIVKKRIGASGADSVAAARDSMRIISQAAEGFKEIRVAGKEDFFLEELRKASDLYARASTYAQSLTVVPRYLIEASVISFLVCLMVVGLVFYGGPSPELMSTLGIFAFAALRAMPSVNALLFAGNNLRFGRTAMYELACDLREAARPRLPGPAAEPGARAAEPGGLRFDATLCAEAISFTYPGKSIPAVRGVTLCIAKGEAVGIIGSSGSGKTTFVDLLVGLLSPDEGRVLVDGRDINGNRREWMDRIAYIPQSVFLLDDTITANVAFGIPSHQVDRAKVRESLRLAQLESMIASLPEGEGTLVGQRGARVSGGQRQRIALARALYDRRDLLIMDEATAALDSQTEREVVETVKALRGTATMILIAHRLTTLRYCDRIYELENGRLLRSGSYWQVVGEGAAQVQAD